MRDSTFATRYFLILRQKYLLVIQKNANQFPTFSTGMNQTTTSLPRRSPQALALLLTTSPLLPRPGAAAVSYYTAAWRGVLGLLVGVWVGVAATAQAQTTTFAFTGSPQAYTVPAGVTQLRVIATGAGGGGAVMFGGGGARVEAFVAVTPGEVLTVVVGGQGSQPGGGYNGGGSGSPTTGSGPTGRGGGGATDLRRLPANGSTGDYLTTRNALLVAGGGGGSYGSADGQGGDGGTPTGGSGSGTFPVGAGGTTTGPGGSGGQGGAGSPNNSGSSYGGNGGGGGGYYGGGGGLGGFGNSSGGGGGSSYVLPLAGSTLVGYTLAAPGDGALSLTPFAGVAFLFTGAPQTYTVPAGVTRLLVEATGASGGRRNGGLGARAQATVTVVPGEVLTVVVGGQGGNVTTAGYNGGGSGTGPTGGGGGGATDLRRLPANGSTGDYLTTRNALLVAGGGGAAAGSLANNPGGSGGVPDGSAGAPAARGGQGATTTAAGAGSGAGSSGSTSSGGNGGGTGGGGGGGGGYYGGGGGSGSPLGGGGGGSSLVLPTGSSNISYTLAPVAEDGLLTITPLAAPTLTALSPATGPVGTSVTLTGTNLTGTTSITFAGTSNNTVTSGFTVNAAGTSITGVVVPAGATTGNVTATAAGGTSNGRSFTVTTAPTVATSAATGITPTAATLNGTVSSDGGRAITSRGFRYGTSATLAGASSQTVSGTTGAYSFNLSGLLPATTYYFRATATNALGTSTGSILSFMTSALPVTPTPTVTAPANGSSTNDPTPTYQGTAPAGSTVTVYVDGASMGPTTATTGGTFSLTPSTGLSQGSHTVYATAQSTGSTVSADSNPNTFRVDTTPPNAPVVVAPANGATTTNNRPTYAGTAEANSIVTVFVGGSSIGTTTADGAGNWTLPQPTALADGARTVRATATDAAGNVSASSTTNTFTVDTNQAPVITNQTRSVAENSANGTNVGAVVAATDPDMGQSLTYNLTAGNTAGKFAINSSTGQLTVAGALDFEGTASYVLTVQVADNGVAPRSSTATVTVSVTNVNEAPVLADATRSVAENSAIGTTVGVALAGTDPDAGTTLSYSITGGNAAGKFAINSSTGQLTVAGALNFETTPSYALTVRASDGSLSDDATVTVSVTNVNEAPSISAQTRSIAGNSANGTLVGAPLTATDPDAGTTLTYAITAGNGTGSGAFAISSSGQLSVADLAQLDFETTPTFTLTVRVSDGSLPASNTVTVNLTPVAAPLPVELVRFTAEARGAGALLQWATASEKNNDHFEVEASADGRTYQRLGQVSGHGSSPQPHAYQFLDPALARYAASPVYYRLRQVDTDGTFSYSPVRAVALTSAGTGLSLYPNPAVGHAATLTGTAPGGLVTVVDALGRPVTQTTADALGTAALALPAGLPAGVYVVRVGSQALRLAVE